MRVYKVVVISPILAMYTIPARLVVPPGKYPKDVVDHIDRVFLRIQGKPTILGSTIKAAIKRAMGDIGIPSNMPKIYYMLCDEDIVTLYKYSIVVKDKQTLSINEIILPNDDKCILLASEKLAQYLKKPINITIGGKRKWGWGQVIIYPKPPKKQVNG